MKRKAFEKIIIPGMENLQSKEGREREMRCNIFLPSPLPGRDDPDLDFAHSNIYHMPPPRDSTQHDFTYIQSHIYRHNTYEQTPTQEQTITGHGKRFHIHTT
jgi:hypothetical protein